MVMEFQLQMIKFWRGTVVRVAQQYGIYLTSQNSTLRNGLKDKFYYSNFKVTAKSVLKFTKFLRYKRTFSNSN